MPIPLAKLDWRSYHDPRSRDFAARDLLAITTPRTARHWSPGQVLDQGQEGACVGFSWTGEALASPIRVNFGKTPRFGVSEPNTIARDIYYLAKTLDEYQGENYEGTSVLAGAKAMVQQGFIKQYRWCFGADDVRDTVIHLGPVVLGIPWHNDMFNVDANHQIHPGGGVAGGHAILCHSYDSGMFRLQNSWGAAWGQNGGAWISIQDLATLLADQGEACVPIGRSYGRVTVQ